MSLLDQRYRQLRAIDANDFHTCFYCGCIATEFDFAPPKAHWQSFQYRQLSADNLQVPSCMECIKLLKGCTMGLVQQRRELVHTKIASKYKKAIGVFLRWNEDELEELDFSLHHSIAAGLKLGEESHRRSNYVGFAYEIDGAKATGLVPTAAPIKVFGEQYASVKDALVAVSKSYRINQAKLVEGMAKHDNNLEAVVMAWQQQQEHAMFQRELRKQCAAFAKQHKQSHRFVVNEIERYLDKDAELSIADALDKLYQERVQHYQPLVK
ncbi:hypothetical protein DU002_14795 [Corallincola holothuriorum]|uniref:Uncharacterized protein n=1 Tax=Corallincola holothuriorum TaxID=2282215 RepID=A0A368N843_9GAMM|nr:hypothetical protein [Corallincola holothuriorum]RCU45724.1 hypothetical protein DU002_14795 [Corallincola holothuriorum]